MSDPEVQSEPVDPDAPQKQEPVVIVGNPHITMSHIHKAWAADHEHLVKIYRYTIPHLESPLILKGSYEIADSTLRVTWLLYNIETDGLEQKKVIYVRLVQKLIPFARVEAKSNEGVVSLRGLQGSSLVEDLLLLVKQAGVTATKAKLTAEEEAEAAKAKAVADAEAKAEEEAKAPVKGEDYIPPAYEALGDFKDDVFSDTGLVLAPGLSHEDLFVPLSERPVAPPVVAPVAPEPKQETAEEKTARINALGALAYKDAKVHSQVASFYRTLVEHFHLLVTILVEKESGPVANLHATLFVVDDVQHNFESNYEAIDEAKEVEVSFFPVQITDKDHLWLGKQEVDKYHSIAAPQKFRFSAKFSADHKLASAEVIHEEKGLEATPLMKAHVAKFLAAIDKLIGAPRPRAAPRVLPKARGVTKPKTAQTTKAVRVQPRVVAAARAQVPQRPTRLPKWVSVPPQKKGLF